MNQCYLLYHPSLRKESLPVEARTLPRKPVEETSRGGDYDEPALAAIADDDLDNEYHRGLVNVELGAEEANEAEAALDDADYEAEDFAAENEDYLAHEAYHQAVEIPHSIYNAEHGFEEDLMLNLY